MKAIFIAPGGMGSGEMITAMTVAQQLIEKGVKCSFATLKSGAQFLQGKKFDTFIFGPDKKKNILRFQDYIKKYSPNIIIFADYYLFHIDKNLRKFLWFGFLEDLNIPILSFDNLGLGRTYPSVPFIISPECFPSRKYKIDFAVPSWVKSIISPCPPFTPCKRKDLQFGRIYDTKKLTRYHNEGPIKIVWPIPKWSLINTALDKTLDKTPYYYMVASLLMWYLKNLNAKIELFCISPQSAFFSRCLIPSKIRLHLYHFLPPDQYITLLSSSDLLVTDNIISSTIGKAVLANIPVILLTNSLKIFKNGDEIKILNPKGFSLIPEFKELMRIVIKNLEQIYGQYFYTLCDRIYKDSLFVDTFLQAEMFDAQGTKEIFQNVLFNTEFKENLKAKQNIYIKKISNIPTMSELVLEYLL